MLSRSIFTNARFVSAVAVAAAHSPAPSSQRQRSANALIAAELVRAVRSPLDALERPRTRRSSADGPVATNEHRMLCRQGPACERERSSSFPMFFIRTTVAPILDGFAIERVNDPCCDQRLVAGIAPLRRGD
jgi:hypothetical protein